MSSFHNNNNNKIVRTTIDDIDGATAVESFGGEDYVLAEDDEDGIGGDGMMDYTLGSIKSADTFSVSGTPDGSSGGGGGIDGGCTGHQDGEGRTPWPFAWSGVIVTSRFFKRTVIVLILLSSVTIALSTMDWVRDYPNRVYAFSIVKSLFLIAFTLELCLRFLYAGPRFFTDGWYVFDFIVISSSWVVYPLLALRTFRLVRSMRLATRVRDLQYIAQALLASVPKMLCICFLLAIQFYTFSIVFTDLFKDLYKDGYTPIDYFGRLDTTCLTLFQIMTLDDWGSITAEVMEAYEWAWFPFVLFIMTSSFFFLNLIIAVICEAVSTVAHKRQLEKLGRRIGIPNIVSGESIGSAVAMKTDADLMRMEEKVDKVMAQQAEILLLLRKQS